MDVNIEKTDNLILNSLEAYQKAVDVAAIVSIADTEGNIIYANDLFCGISKFKREELIGANHRIINSGFHPDSFFRDLWSTISSGKIWRGEIKNKAKDGTFYWVDTTISPIFNSEGDIAQYLSIRSLITARKDLETVREKLLDELTHKYNDLMQFNFIVSHNLRNPVSNLIGLAEMITEECENCDDNIKGLIRFISESALSIDEVIKDLTQILSASNSDKQKIEDINLNDIIKSATDNLKKQISESGAQLQIDIGDEAVHFKTIKTYLQSIIYNMVNNGIKYARENVHPVISIKAEKNNKHIIIKIADNGSGMDLNKIGNQLFGLYKRFDFKKDGRGLGLHMTKTQVESLGGKIEVSSQPGIGSTFIITLPV